MKNFLIIIFAISTITAVNQAHAQIGDIIEDILDDFVDGSNAY